MEYGAWSGEASWNQMKRLFLFVANDEEARRLLYRHYIKQTEEKEAREWSYANTHKFCYFIRQGLTYFNDANHTSLMVKPLLLFYGMTSLKKALLLLYDAHYPKTTSVLQHGLTTRKRKKSDYAFSEDHVKIQKDGLLPYFSKTVLSYPLVINKKYQMKTLLGLFPELQPSYRLLYKEITCLPIQRVEKEQNLTRFRIHITPEHEHSHHPDPEQLLEKVKEQIIHYEEHTTDGGGKQIYFSIPEESYRTNLNEAYNATIKTDIVAQQPNPTILYDVHGQAYLYLGDRDIPNTELISYHLVIYILSMLCRYDTEAWGELLFSYATTELFLIDQLVALTSRKYPNLILNHLFEQSLYFPKDSF